MHYHISVKFVAVFLCALALLAAIASGFGIYIVAEQGLYGTDVADIQDQQLRTNLRILAEDLAVRYAAQTYSNCPQALIDSYVGTYYIEELLAEGLWYYTLEDMNGQVLDSSSFSTDATPRRFEFAITPKYPTIIDDAADGGLLTPDIFSPEDPTESTQEEAEGQPIFQEEISHTWSDRGGKYTHTLGIYKHHTYLVTVYLLKGAYEYQDSLQWQILGIAQQYRYTLMAVLAAGLLVFAICAVYLCVAAARAPGLVEKRAGGLNRLPLDLYLFLMAGIVLLLSWGIYRLTLWISDPSYLLPGASAIGLCGYGASLVFISFWFAVAAQCKSPDKMWLRNTLLYRFCKLLGQLGKRLICWAQEKLRRLRQLLPVTWQWLLTGTVLLAILIAAFLLESTELIILSALLLLLAIVYTGYAFGVLMDGTRKMSRGDLHCKIGGKWIHGLFRDFSTYLSDLANVAVIAAKKQSRSERMKAELITNVSHDIKTPLTSIINYVDLLQHAQSEHEAQEYLEVLDRQSLRLKKLIDDLMEMSKASTGNMTVEPVELNAAEAVNQALGEFSDKLDARRLTVVFMPPTEPVTMLADGRLTWRVLSNLLSNTVKYALEGTRVYVDVVRLEENVLISFKNISAQPLNISSEELMERFVRGDASRNTEGSGLGLNIAKSLMELQKGQLHLLVDGDLFKATLIFPQKH